MVTKIKIKSIDGKLLFEHECTDNTIRTTLEVAVNQCIYLSRANLYRAYLEGANLKGVTLKGADMLCANLEGANL